MTLRVSCFFSSDYIHIYIYIYICILNRKLPSFMLLHFVISFFSILFLDIFSQQLSQSFHLPELFLSTLTGVEREAFAIVVMNRRLDICQDKLLNLVVHSGFLSLSLSLSLSFSLSASPRHLRWKTTCLDDKNRAHRHFTIGLYRSRRITHDHKRDV